MKGSENKQTTIFSYASMEHRIPDNHPLREIRKLVGEALRPLHDLS